MTENQDAAATQLTVRERAHGVEVAAPRGRENAPASASGVLWLWTGRIVVVSCIVALWLPVVWVAGTSFEAGQIFDLATFLPTNLTLAHYHHLLAHTEFWSWVKNSLIVCCGTASLTALIVPTLVFALPARRSEVNATGVIPLVLSLFPAELGFLAYVYLLKALGLIDAPGGLILVLVVSEVGFFTWLLRYRGLGTSEDIRDAACLDGASPWQIYFHVILPLLRSPMIGVFLISLLTCYNEFLISSVVLTSPENFTIPLGLQRLLQGHVLTTWNDFAAAAVLVSLPNIIVFALTLRTLRRVVYASAESA